MAFGLLLLAAYGVAARHGPALPDEYRYLASARHFAETGKLDARFYTPEGLLAQGYPHQDDHAPGYVILLGSLMAVAGSGYWTAVAFNMIAFLAGIALIYGLCLDLGMSQRCAWASGALYVLLPLYLPYVYWVMPECLLGTLTLATLASALRYGNRTGGAIATGVLFGLAFLVRESALFALPAAIGLLVRRGKLPAFLATAALFLLFVFAPLSLRRAAGGANFWVPSSGRVLAFSTVRAVEEGNVVRALEMALGRAAQNIAWLRRGEISPLEVGILGLFVVLPACALGGWRLRTDLERRALKGLVLGWTLLVAVIFGFYVVNQGNGFRYLMVLMPPFLPWVGRKAEDLPARTGWSLLCAVGLACSWLDASSLGVFNRYRGSRQRRQENIASYVEQYIGNAPLTRAVVWNGHLFGLRHYPVELIAWLPESGEQLRALEREVWFEYLVLPRGHPLANEVKDRVRYQLLDGEERRGELWVFRRLR